MFWVPHFSPCTQRIGDGKAQKVKAVHASQSIYAYSFHRRSPPVQFPVILRQDRTIYHSLAIICYAPQLLALLHSTTSTNPGKSSSQVECLQGGTQDNIDRSPQRLLSHNDEDLHSLCFRSIAGEQWHIFQPANHTVTTTGFSYLHLLDTLVHCRVPCTKSAHRFSCFRRRTRVFPARPVRPSIGQCACVCRAEGHESFPILSRRHESKLVRMCRHSRSQSVYPA